MTRHLVAPSPPSRATEMAPSAEARELRLFDVRDVPWVEELLDLVERACGEPWRVLLDRVELTQWSVPRYALQAMLSALRRLTGGRAERVRIARTLRGQVLGVPCLDPAARTARVEAVAAELGLDADELDTMLWADLARERPVVLPHGRPAALDLLAIANLDKLQFAVRRAHELRLAVPGDATALVRAAGRYGLVCTVSRRVLPASTSVTELCIAGPLAMFHATTLYGRALAGLMPLLARYPDHVMTLHAAPGARGGAQTLRGPLLLPPPRQRGPAPSIAERLVRDLRAAGCEQVQHEPPPIAHEARLLYPEVTFVRGDRRWWVEILGFSTRDFLQHRHARYRAAGIVDVVLCVDARGHDAAILESPHWLPFRKTIDVVALLLRLEELR